MTNALLSEKKVFVAEDEFLLADELCRELERAGAFVVGPVPSVKRALAVIATEQAIDAAVLDANLGGEMVYPIADALLARAIPLVFTSGYDEAVLEHRYPHVPRCQKPTRFSDIAEALAAALTTTPKAIRAVSRLLTA